ncbi:hypothetical protein CLCAR_4134 [Clostridium carboxidivorans P7]|nr:hypothetical protein CLCAR_4134 [Clostridium carboxidivorans P7]
MFHEFNCQIYCIKIQYMKSCYQCKVNFDNSFYFISTYF